MTNDEMCNIYLRSVGRYRDKGGRTLEPILPFIMMDSMLQLYQKDIAPLKCKQMLRHCKKEWSRCYTEFNNGFFKAFTKDQQDEIIEKMDSFSAYIANDLLVAKVQIMNCVKEEPFDKQNILASCMLCTILAQAAQIIWTTVYKTRTLKDQKNTLIEGIFHYATRFMNLYHSTPTTVDCNKSEPVSKAVQALCNKMVKWCYHVDLDELENN